MNGSGVAVSNRLQYAMLFVLLCICAPPVLALWMKGGSAVPEVYSWTLGSSGLLALVGYLLWRRRSVVIRYQRDAPTYLQGVLKDTGHKLVHREK